VNELFRMTDPENLTDPGAGGIEVLDPQDPTPAQAQAAHEVASRIKTNILSMRTIWVQIAEDLYRFHDLDMWKDLGHSSFEQWLAQPEIQLGRRTVFNLIEVWRELVVNKGVQPRELMDVKISNVRDVLAAVRRGYVDPDDAIADCRMLGRDDLRTKYQTLATPAGARRDPAGLLPSPDEPGGSGAFDATSEPRYAVCHVCGSRYQVREAA
jgi:hypothetical protein